MDLERHESARFINLELDAWAAITSAYEFKLKAGEEQRALTSLSYLSQTDTPTGVEAFRRVLR